MQQLTHMFPARRSLRIDSALIARKEICMGSNDIKPNYFFMQARLNLGFSQQDVARRLGVSLRTVWRWEKGKAQPYPHHRQLLCALFQKTAEELGFASASPLLPASTSLATSVEARFQAYMERCQADPMYQREYQTYLQRCLHFSSTKGHIVSFVDWFLVIHSEQITTGEGSIS